jgi:flagellar basal-body rod modification protein FlgD
MGSIAAAFAIPAAEKASASFSALGRTKVAVPGQPAADVAADVAAAQTSSTAADSSASSDAGTITSSDFLTLLVTELKNQDPSSTQDPNAYIDQLVQVNSLQQLISINQELAPPAATTTTASVSGQELAMGDQASR